ncbi:MAG: metallopeptidase family protein [Candidatus Omnitrophica bacterium]|nr:metallopeptidase family protein [Candidatus Omnitrophota bacterium]
MKVSRKDFEEIVYRKFQLLPSVIRQNLDNVEIFIQEEPPAGQFLGLYQGVPFPKRKNPGYSLILPDKIFLYQGPIQRASRNQEELEKMIEQVLFHEVGHYLGLTEKQLRQMQL